MSRIDPSVMAQALREEAGREKDATIARLTAEVAELRRERDALREGIRELHSGTGEDGDPCKFCNLAGYT